LGRSSGILAIFPAGPIGSVPLTRFSVDSVKKPNNGEVK
jgi:hypothetical protein